MSAIGWESKEKNNRKNKNKKKKTNLKQRTIDVWLILLRRNLYCRKTILSMGEKKYVYKCVLEYYLDYLEAI